MILSKNIFLNQTLEHQILVLDVPDILYPVIENLNEIGPWRDTVVIACIVETKQHCFNKKYNLYYCSCPDMQANNFNIIIN